VSSAEHGRYTVNCLTLSTSQLIVRFDFYENIFYQKDNISLFFAKRIYFDLVC